MWLKTHSCQTLGRFGVAAFRSHAEQIPRSPDPKPSQLTENKQDWSWN